MNGRKQRWPVFLLSLSFFAASIGVSEAQQVIPIVGLKRDTPVSFEREILPLFRKSCLACHNAADAEGGLVLETPQSILAGGDSGAAAVARNGNESLLLKVASHREEPFMPPLDNDRNAPPLTSEQLGLIKLWIDQGAQGDSTDGVLSPKAWLPLPSGVNPIYSVAVTPDGQFAACGRANQIFIYHVPTGQLITRLTDPALQAQSADPRPGIAHRDVVQSLAFNREGDLLASGGFRVVKLWRYPRDVQRFSLTAATDAVTAVAVSPDGKLIATGAADNTIKLFSASEGKDGLTLEGHAGPVTSLRFAQNAAQLYSSSADQTIRVWNVADGSLAGRIDTPTAIDSISLVSQPPPAEAQAAEAAEAPAELPQLIASAGGDNLIRLWRTPNGLPQQLADVPEKTNVLAVSTDRKFLALANAAGEIHVSNFASGELVKTWKAHEAAITGIAFKAAPEPAQPADANAEQPEEPTVPTLATSSADQTVRLWNYETGEDLGVLRGSLNEIHCVAFQPDGKRLIAGAADGGVTVWNLEADAPRSLEGDNGAPATVTVVSPDGERLATSGLSNDRPVIYVRDIATGRLTHTLMGHEAPIAALAFSADNTKIVSGSADKTARVWDLSDEKFPELQRFSGHADSVNAVSFNADGQQVLSGSADNSVKLWAVADAAEVMDFAGHTGPIVAVAMATGNQPVSASADKTVRVWNPANGQQVRATTEAAAVTAMSITRDGTRVAVAIADNSIKLYQIANGQVLQTLAGHKGAINSLAFSADNTRLVSGSADNQAIVWNVADGRLLEILPVETGLSAATYGPTTDSILLAAVDKSIELHSLRFGLALTGMTEQVTAIAYNPNGQTAYTSCLDGTVRGYTLANGQQAFSATHGAPVHDLSLSPDGQKLASAGENQHVKLWNPANGGPLNPPQLTGFVGPVHSVSFSADSSRVIAGSGTAEANDLLVFNVAGYLEQSFVGHTGLVEAVATVGEFDDRVVSASADGTVRSWQLLADKQIAGHTQPVTSLATIPDAPMQILSGSRDGTVRRWNLLNAQPILQMNHGAPVTAVAVRDDGQRFASASENNTAKLWNGPNGQQLAEMKGDIRADTLVAKLTQEKAAAQEKVTETQAALKAAEEDLPKKSAAAKTAADALAAATKDVEAKATALAQAETTKAAAEKVAIESAAAAQKAANVKEAADQLALELAAKARILADKATQARALAQANPEDQSVAAAAEKASVTAGAADAEAKAAEAAKAAPTKAAADAAAAANDAATKALATNKPYTDALTAFEQSQAAKRVAAQASEIAAREEKEAQELVPLAKADSTAAETKLQQLTTDLETATKAAADALKPIRTIAFSPNNRTLATGGDFAAVHAWDADSGKAIASYVGHAGPVQALAFTADGGLISGSADKTTNVWELSPGWTLERTIGDINDPSVLINRVAAVDFSSDGKLLAVGGGVPSRNGEIKIFNVADGSLVTSIPEAHTDCVFGVEFSPDGKYIASASADKYVRTFDVGTGQQVMQFEGHTNYVLGVSWRSNGRVLASCGADNQIKVWNAQTGDRIRDIAGFNKQVTAVQFIGQTQFLMSCSGDNIVRMINSDNGGAQRNFGGAVDFMYSIDVTPDSQIVISGGYDSVLRIWNGANAQVLHAIEPPQEPDATADAAETVGQQAAN